MWEIDVNDQIVTFLLSIVLGVMVCVLYDIFRAFRRAVPHNTFAVFLEDIFFWLLAALINFVFLMGRTGGGLRGYVFVGETVGFFAFRLTVSGAIVFVLSAAISFVLKLYRAAVGKTADFLAVVGGFLSRFLAFLIKNLKRVAKRVKKLLKSRAHLLYTEINNI